MSLQMPDADEIDINQIAARVNFYKTKQQAINWEKITAEYNADMCSRLTAKQVKSFYTQNNQGQLDDIYIIKEIINLNTKYPGRVLVQWEGFPIDDQMADNYVNWKNLPTVLYDDYYHNHLDTAEVDFGRFAREALRKLRTENICPELKNLVCQLLSDEIIDPESLQSVNKVESMITNKKPCEMQFVMQNGKKFVNFDCEGEIHQIQLNHVLLRKKINRYVLNLCYDIIVEKFKE